MDICVRPAGVGDLPAISAIYNDAVLTTTASFAEEPESLDERRAWFDAHVAAEYPIFVAEINGEVVGWSSLSQFHARICYRFTAEVSVYVAAPFRGQGIGRCLLPPLLDAARVRGLHTLFAGVTADNAASLRLHASCGFVPIGQFREVGFKFGRWLDVIALQWMVEKP